MTTGTFRAIPISSITIAPDRQRKELRGMEELIASISQHGLINPILITPDLVLIAGERRLTACTRLGWTTIPAQLTTDLPPGDLQLLELEENIKRVDLTWQEQADAVLRYHTLRTEADPTWTMEDSGNALSMTHTYVSRYLGLAEAIASGDETIAKAETVSTARGLLERRQARKAAESESAIAAFFGAPLSAGDAAAEEDTPPLGPPVPFVNADWTTWTPPHRFNFLHCDFPYGVNADKHAQGAADAFGGYSDGFEIYDKLLTYLAGFTEECVSPSAHMLFWFSMDFYQLTFDRLTSMGWRVNPFPCIWYKSDNSGILPDPKRGPRRSYETAFLCSRGDRPVVRAVSNVYAGPNTKTIHMSEKPVEMLSHFFRMLVDESTVMLDPTMGSGNSVLAAEQAGAKSAIGLELSEEFYSRACIAYLQRKGDAED